MPPTKRPKSALAQLTNDELLKLAGLDSQVIDTEAVPAEGKEPTTPETSGQVMVRVKAPGGREMLVPIAWEGETLAQFMARSGVPAETALKLYYQAMEYSGNNTEAISQAIAASYQESVET